MGQLGVQLSQKKGYAYGWYPRFGKATDYTWVAGDRIPKGACFLPVCGCTFISEPTKPTFYIEPVGTVWLTAINAGQVKYGLPVVLFGHFPAPGEPVPQLGCPGPAYIVDNIQLNPASRSTSSMFLLS